MIIPIRTDRRLTTTPWMNTVLVVVNFIIFFAEYSNIELQQYLADFSLSTFAPQWYQFFTYQFLHGDIMHIGFNMLFLWVFGQHLEDRFGHFGFLAFYLAGGAFAGVGYALTQEGLVIGASGAVSAVTGAYLALFPVSRCRLLFFFLFVYFFEIPSMYLILFSFLQDVFFQFSGAGRVAYIAHISGSIFGFSLGMFLLATRILPREPYDFLSMVDRWNRRRQLKAVTRNGYSPWAGSHGLQSNKPTTPEQQSIMDYRATISKSINAQPEQALSAYTKLIELAPDQVLARQMQLDIATFAMNSQQFQTAAHAYRGFLKNYGNDSFAPEVKMILALLYIRHLEQPEDARPLLEESLPDLTNAEHITLANHLIGELKN